MPTDVDFLDLQLKVNRATPEQQRTLLDWLLSRVTATVGGGPRMINGEGGEPIGVFIPKTHYRNPQPMSEEEYAKLQEAVRNTTPNQLLTHDEMLRQLGLGGVRPPSKQ